MTVVDFTFPQSGDSDYAENFGTWLGRSAITDYVEEGMTFTVDYSVPEVTISQGKAFIEIPEKTISANSETRLSLDYVVIKPSETISLSDNSVNFIYLNPNIGSNDSPSFNAYTNETNAASDSLKIGEIDTSNNTKNENFNRAPDSTFDTGSFSFVLNIPVYDDTSNAEGGQGNVIYITGSGSESSGIYIDTGAGFEKAGIDTITELNDVNGVTALIEDSESNRPSAGTEGRIFFNTTNDTVEYDNGSSWQILGQDPANIGPGDLGFDTATQSELDDHTATNDAHHSRPIAGNGLKESSGNFNVEPDDFDGTFLSDDGTDNLTVNIGRGLENDGTGTIQFDEDTDYTFTTAIDFSAGLDTQGDITDGTTVIWDVSNQYIPQGQLENDSITINANDGIKSGGTVSLGSSVGLDVEPADFAGSGVEDDGSDNIRIASTAVGDGLKGGSGSAITIEPADFAGTYLSDDGTDDLQVNIGSGLEGDGAGNIRVDEDTDFTFTSAIDFSAGLDTQGDISDGTQVIWDASAQEIPDSAMGSVSNSTLSNDSVTINANDGLKSGGAVSLGGSVGLDIEPADFAGTYLSDDGADNLTVDIGLGLENDGSGNIRVDEDTDFTFTSTIDFSAGLDTQDNIKDGTQTIWDATNQEIPDSAMGSIANSTLTNSSVTVTAGNSLTGGGSVSLGGSITLDLGTVENTHLSNDSITINANDGLKSGGTVSLGGSVGIDVEPNDFAGTYLSDDGADNLTINLGSGLQGDGTGNITLTNDSITINANDGLKSGGTVALGGSVGLDIEPADFAGTYLSDDGADNLTVNIGAGLENDGAGSIRVDEDTDFTFTSTIDFSAGLDTQGDISDGTQVIWDASAQEIPDSAMGSIANSTLTNSSVTVTAGNSLTGGGTVSLGGSITIDLGTVENSHLSNDSITINANDGLKSGGTVSLGGSVGIDVEPNDFAGTYLSDDGADNLTVDIGRGLENDGSGNIRFDEDTSYTLTAATTINNTLTVSDNTDLSGGNKMSLPQVTADPSASAGEMWYRTDLD